MREELKITTGCDSIPQTEGLSLTSLYAAAREFLFGRVVWHCALNAGFLLKIRWFALGIIWDENANIHEKLYIAKQGFMQPFFFMEVFMIGAWCLWNERNDLIFNGNVPNFI